jgi:molecular chaperone DnaK (HSP70)
MVKVLREANKFKETLSANKQAMFFVENILEGEDFRVAITREQFEHKCQHYFTHLTSPV